MSRCLLLVDLQNEFLSTSGNFPVNSACLPFLDSLESVVHHFRTAGDPIIWIRSEYNTTPLHSPRDPLDRAAFLAGTHTGRKPCCERDSPGAEFPDRIAVLIDHSVDKVVTKTWFSAFKETALASALADIAVTDLFVGGLLTNVCVCATVTDAVSLPVRVHVLEDCVGWRVRTSHEHALANMRKLGARVLSGADLISPPIDDHVSNVHRESVQATIAPPVVHDCLTPLPTLYYVNGSIPSWRVMMALYEKAIHFDSKRLKVMSDPRETRLPPFLAINHRGKTPVFVDIIPARAADSTDGSIQSTTINVNESLAILQYLETYHKPDIPLLPPLSQRKERALALARMQETENLHYAYDDLEAAHFAASNKTEPLTSARRAELILAVHKELDFWEVYATQADFIAGKTFGLADCAFFPILAYMVHRGFVWRRPRPPTDDGRIIKPRRTAKGKIIPGQDEADSWPHLKAYFERVWNRNGVNGCAQKAQPDGWHGRGKANVWKGTTGNAKPLKKGVPRPSQSG